MKFLSFLLLLFIGTISLAQTPKITQGEYFWDTDPGLGLGIPLQALDGNFDTAIENLFKSGIPTSALSVGAHSFKCRAKGLDGTWSNSFSVTIYVNSPVTTITRNVKITHGEYFWDADPGFGLGTPLLALDGSFDTAIEELFKNGIPTSALSIGAHSFKCRTKGLDGTWSNSFSVTIYVNAPVTVITRTVKIIQGEYFWDTDPGLGLATPLLAVDGAFDTAIEHMGSTAVSTTGLSGGPHSLAVRTKGFDGVWSQLFRQTVYVTCGTPVAASVTILASNSSMCSGSTVTFTATPTNGGTAPIYQWKKNGLSVGSSLATYAVSNLANGDIITCELTSSDLCASPSLALSNAITVTINPAVTTAISISSSAGATLCAGASVVFTAIPTNGGASPIYQWKKNGINVGSGLVTYAPTNLVNGDVITCHLTSSDVCASPSIATSNSIYMTVSSTSAPVVTISSNKGNSICSGAQVVFTGIFTPGGMVPIIQWKKNGINVGTGATTYTANNLTNGDVITCVFTSSNPCATPATVMSNAITMMINSPTVSIQQTSQTLTATLGFTSYQWSLNGIQISGATTNVHNATLNGLYAVTATDANGCTATTSLNYFSVGISTMSAQNFNLYPNPSTGNVTISFTDVEDRTIEVVDMLGKLVYKATSTQQNMQLNLQDLVTSTYTVVITNQNGSKTYVKLVISK